MPESSQIIRLSEVALNKSSSSAWIVINDKVYDVTKFLCEHPGGKDVILNIAGRDATEDFDDIGHSSDAVTMAEDYFIGDLHPNDCKGKK